MKCLLAAGRVAITTERQRYSGGIGALSAGVEGT
jgi:hypothetical protein